MLTPTFHASIVLGIKGDEKVHDSQLIKSLISGLRGNPCSVELVNFYTLILKKTKSENWGFVSEIICFYNTPTSIWIAWLMLFWQPYYNLLVNKIRSEV